ncbi:MAG: glycosyltransferase [Bacteroidota bacterium]
MISVIICSVNKALLKDISKNIEQTIGIDYEVIAIDNTQNQYSIAQAYNLGANTAKYPYLCFVHEDILFHTKNWGVNLIGHLSDISISLVGILGSLVKTKTPSGVYIPLQKLNRINQLQRTKNGCTNHYYENPHNEIYSEVKLLDGMFLATTKMSHARYNFDEELLTGFHGYDIDYSLGQAVNGKLVVVYNILIEHFSYGGNTVPWVDAQLKITNKWLDKLPQHVNLSKAEILTAEITNTDTFLIALYNNRYNKAIQLKHLLRLLRLRRLSFKNFYFLRRFFIYGALEDRIKSTLNRH